MTAPHCLILESVTNGYANFSVLIHPGTFQWRGCTFSSSVFSPLPTRQTWSILRGSALHNKKVYFNCPLLTLSQGAN